MITIKKKNIYKSKLFSLRLIKKSDTNGDWYKWFNDKRITKFMDKGDYKNTRLKQLNYFKKIDKSKTDIIFAICNNKGVHIGNVGLHSVKNKSAQFGILIGDSNYHKKGIGKKTWYLISKFAFKNLKLNIINTKIFEKNLGSIKIAKLIGYKENKKKNEYIYKNKSKFKYISFKLTKENFLIKENEKKNNFKT